MKRSKILTLLVAATTAFSLASCDREHEAKISIEAGTLKTEYELDEKFDCSSMIINYVDTKGATHRIEADDEELSWTDIDTTTPGNKTFTVTYKRDLTTSAQISVLAKKVEGYVMEFIAPLSIFRFMSNTGATSSFKTTDLTYTVGTVNPVVLVPQVSYLPIDGDDPIDLAEYAADVTVSEKQEDGSYVVLSGSALEEAYAEPKTNHYQFNIPNKEYRVKFAVKPEDAPAALRTRDYSIDIQTINAYNAHNLVEFSLVDTRGGWAAEQEAAGIEVPENLKGVVLHNDLQIRAVDLPDSKLDHEAMNLASYADYALLDGIYIFNCDSTDEFTISGNCFQIDGEALPRVLRDDGSHTVIPKNNPGLADTFLVNSSIFRFGNGYGETGTIEEWQENSSKIENVRIIGNGGISNDLFDVTAIYGIKVGTTKFTSDNVIVEQNLVSYCLDVDKRVHGGEHNIINGKVNDSFRQSVWAFEIENVFIENTDIAGAGGPGIQIEDFSNNEKYLEDVTGTQGDNYPSNVTIDNLDRIDTKLTPDEAWFRVNNAAGAATTLAGGGSEFTGISQMLKYGSTMNMWNESLPNQPVAPVPGFTEGRSYVEEKDETTYFGIKAMLITKDFPGTFTPIGTFNVGSKDSSRKLLDMTAALGDPTVPFGSLATDSSAVVFQAQDLAASEKDYIYLGPGGDLYQNGTSITAGYVGSQGASGYDKMVNQLFTGDYLSLYHVAGRLGVLLDYYPVR